MPNEELTDEESLQILTDYITSSMSDAPNLQLPSPSIRDFYRDEKSRIIWIRNQIDASSLNVIKKIMNYNKADAGVPVELRKPIKIFLDTPGGSVQIMWSIVNAIKMSKTPVYTYNYCVAMSAGSHILAAGHKRFGFPGSTVLIHSGSCMFSGTQEQADSAKKFYDALGKKADEQLLSDTKIDSKTFKKKSPFDWYIDTEDALKYGIIDKIVEDYEEAYN